MKKLEGKVVMVTGASRGIGAAAALALGAAGAAVMLAARNEAAASEIAATIIAKGGKATAMACDVSSFNAVQHLVDETRRRLGPVDILVNNAGVIEPIAPIAQTDPAVWAEAMRINLLGVYNGVRAVLPAMIASGRGTIVNVSTGAAFEPLEGWSAYCASKAGVAMLTRSVALEAGPAGIRVFGFAPGTCDTDMQVVIRASGLNRISKIPRGDLTPVERPAKAIVYLCTAEADDLSGREIALRDPAFADRVEALRD